MKRLAIAAIIAFALAASVPNARADDRPVTPVATVAPAATATPCPRLNCIPVPCEWYPGGWPFETPESIADASTWTQYDPDGTCAVEVPANAPKPSAAPTLPPTDTAA